MVNQHEFRVLSMMRSGHHAIATWIMTQAVAEDDNDVALFRQTPLLATWRAQYTCADRRRFCPQRDWVVRPAHKQLKINPQACNETTFGCFLLHAQKVTHINSAWWQTTDLTTGAAEDFDVQGVLAAGQTAGTGKTMGPSPELDAIRRKCYCWNVEDPDLASVQAECERKHQLHHDGSSERCTWVLVLRDPFNLLASRHSHRNAGDCDRNGKIAVEMWKQHAREALGDTDYFRGQDMVVVCYNQWFASQEYRRQLARELGLGELNAAADDLAMSHVPLYGRGSSFQGQSAQGQAQSMSVLDRWRGVLHCRLDADCPMTYQQLYCEDGDLIELSQRLFGSLPEGLAEELWPEGSRGKMAPPLAQPLHGGCFPSYSHAFGDDAAQFVAK